MAVEVIKFIDINSIGSKAFKLVLNVCLEAVYRGQHTYNTEYAKWNSDQRKDCAQFIYHKFLHGKPEWIPEYVKGFAHNAS